MKLLVNIDVANLEQASAFYCRALDLSVGRRFDGWVELLGASSPIYLLPKEAGSAVSPASQQKRDYARHWTPVHLDFVVEDLETVMKRAQDAGATLEIDVRTHVWGRIAQFSDPFGNGFCLLEFTGRGYDEIKI
jgi:predicted enzyme related to lactoylglutathione lyase